MHGRTCVVRVEVKSMGVGCQMEASERARRREEMHE
jgi:hypothetical protein